MTAKDFYRILSRVQGVQWTLMLNSRERFGEPVKTTLIVGYRHSLAYSPFTAVASAVRRQFVDRSRPSINTILRLDKRTYRRMHDASLERPGHSPAVRQKLLKACGLPH